MNAHAWSWTNNRTHSKTASAANARRGFSLLEMSLVTGLTSFLAILISSMWLGFGPSFVDTVSRCRVQQEANLAIEWLHRDLSGYSPDQPTGSKADGFMVGRLISGGEYLLVCYDGSPANGAADWGSPDTVCLYRVINDQLVRTEYPGGRQRVLAAHVDNWVLTDTGDGMQIDLTLSHRDIQRTFRIVTRDP